VIYGYSVVDGWNFLGYAHYDSQIGRQKYYYYNHTGKYKCIMVNSGIGKYEDTLTVGNITDLDNLDTYPSGTQLNVSARHLSNDEPAPDFQHGHWSWAGYEYGILGLDNKLHYPVYRIPPYQ